MRVRIIAVGDRMPAWVSEVCADYVRRLGTKLKVSLVEIPAGPRGRGGSGLRAVEIEGERILAELKPSDYLIALDERGKEISTVELARRLAERMQSGPDTVFTIGGPDGLAEAVRARSDFTWSLSRLTLPHALVRVLLAEQLYRAHTVLSGHPYHRA